MTERESIKDKLKKLLALSQRGEGGEAANAKRLLENMCERYNIALEDLLENKKKFYRFKPGKAIYEKLFWSCVFKNITDDEAHHTTYTKCGNVIIILLTAYQYAEITNLFEWHKKNMADELKKTEDAFFDAYRYKHNLFLRESLDDQKEDNAPLTDEELEKLKIMTGLVGAISDKTYTRSLPNK
jgi:hypothetical protein